MNGRCQEPNCGNLVIEVESGTLNAEVHRFETVSTWVRNNFSSENYLQGGDTDTGTTRAPPESPIFQVPSHQSTIDRHHNPGSYSGTLTLNDFTSSYEKINNVLVGTVDIILALTPRKNPGTPSLIQSSLTTPAKSVRPPPVRV